MQEKLAFTGPDATKWTYNVIPFGLVNGPATFIAFIHDVDSLWKELAHSHGVVINKDTNTNIIVDDIVSWAKTQSYALMYMECQHKICKSQNLSLSLKKSHIFPKQFEFVGINVCPEGNRPTMSKHQLLRHWPTPIIVRNVAKFVGFMQFYSQFISHFNVHITALRNILCKDYSLILSALWLQNAQFAFDDMRKAILNNPCLCRYNHCKLLVLCTDFSAEGFGYAGCQPADNNVSLAAMHKCMQGSSFDFMTKDSTALLHPVAFGCRRMCGNKQRLHSHLGEVFSGDYAIIKCCHMAFGKRFVWVTACYALKFILSYDGRNPAILHLQMHFMCWDMIIKHRNNLCLTNANYFSQLGADLCFDPLLKDYVHQIQSIKCWSPSPTELPIAPEHQPYFRGPRLNLLHKALAQESIQRPPTKDGTAALMAAGSNTSARSLYNSDLTRAAGMLTHFDWAVYDFNSGHFGSTIRKRGLPFRVVLACNPFIHRRALL